MSRPRRLARGVPDRGALIQRSALLGVGLYVLLLGIVIGVVLMRLL